MRGGERRHDRLEQAERGDRVERGVGVDDVAQRLALDVLHDDVGPGDVAVDRVRALVEDRDHVRVREARGGAGLTVELARELEVVTQPDVHDLHRDRTGQPGVDPPVDGGHAAAGEPCRDLVPAVEDPSDERVTRGGPARTGSPRAERARRHVCGERHSCSRGVGQVGLDVATGRARRAC